MRPLLIACLFYVSLHAQSPAPTSTIQAGFAERDITPGIGMEQPGGYSKNFHRSFHDACKVRVALFDDGQKRAAVIGLDALVVPRQIVLDARAQIEKATGITGDAVLIANAEKSLKECQVTFCTSSAGAPSLARMSRSQVSALS
jgi:hypothetical protein